MKTILTLVIGLVLTTGMMAASDETTSNAAREHTRSELSKEISTVMRLSGQTLHQTANVAFVELMVTPDGKVQLLHVNAENSAMRQFISDRVGQMQLDVSNIAANEKFSFRIEFKRQSA